MGDFIFFWMHIEGELPACVFLFLQGNSSWAELLLLHLNKEDLGRNRAHRQSCNDTKHHPARCDGRNPCHPAGPMLSWSPVTQSAHWKKAIFGLHFPLTFPCTSHCYKLDVSLVFTCSVRNGCVMSPDCHHISGSPCVAPMLLLQLRSWRSLSHPGRHTQSLSQNGPDLVQNHWPVIFIYGKINFSSFCKKIRCFHMQFRLTLWVPKLKSPNINTVNSSYKSAAIYLT